MHTLFVYGTLMVKEVAEKIIGSYATETAILKNYKRFKIFIGDEEMPYPAIVFDEGKLTEGLLFRNLSDEYIDLLDQYEGEDYDRVRAKIETPTETLDAWIYVWNNPIGIELRGDWDVEEFKKKQLKTYLKSDEF